ncbi:calmodulin-binding transcription activator [Trifolium repens]|nr:calmodulin-binding transcription activator [Trifolium repens]
MWGLEISMVSCVESKDNMKLEIKQWPTTDVTFKVKSIQSFLQWNATCVVCDVIPDAIKLKDSCDYVCNATQVANQICLVFRMQSFQRKQSAKNKEDKSGQALRWHETECHHDSLGYRTKFKIYR